MFKKLCSICLVFGLMVTPIVGCNTLKATGMDKTQTAKVVQTTLLEYLPQARVIVAAIQKDYNEICQLMEKQPNPKYQEYLVMADSVLATLCDFIVQVEKGDPVAVSLPQIANLILLGKKALELKKTLF